MILSCFPNIVRLKSLEALSVRLLSFPFFLIFKVFVQCPKQIFKVSSSKTGVKTDGGGWEGEIQYSRSDWFAPRLSSWDTNPGKKGPGVLPPAVWKHSNPLRALRRGSSDFGQLLTFSLCEKDRTGLLSHHSTIKGKQKIVLLIQKISRMLCIWNLNLVLCWSLQSSCRGKYNQADLCKYDEC